MALASIAGLVSDPTNGVTGASAEPSSDARAELVAERIRHHLVDVDGPKRERLSSFALTHAVGGDLSHIHAAHDLRKVPIVSRRRWIGPGVVRLRRALRGALEPLPEAQSTWNGATARLVSFLIQQLVVQARAIESLERQVAELQDERRDDAR